MSNVILNVNFWPLLCSSCGDSYKHYYLLKVFLYVFTVKKQIPNNYRDYKKTVEERFYKFGKSTMENQAIENGLVLWVNLKFLTCDSKKYPLLTNSVQFIDCINTFHSSSLIKWKHQVIPTMV